MLRIKSQGVGQPEAVFKNSGEIPPKVLIVLEASGGGSGRHVVELVHGLSKSECEVHLLYSELRADKTFRDSLAALKDVKNVHLQQVPMRREPHFSDIACLWQIRRYIARAGGFDIVHAHSSKAGVLARLATLGTQSTNVYTPHAMRTMDPTLHPAFREFYRLIEVGLARAHCDVIIAVSEDERRHIIAQGVSASKVSTVVNGIPAVHGIDRLAVRSSLGIAAEELCVGFIGRLVPQKAPERFVAVMERIVGRLPNARGIVVGTGPLREQVHDLARRAGVYERLVWVTDRQGPTVLPAFDVLLMPSLYEGMPYVLLEALAVGVPVVATDVGGVAEAIESGETGFIVPQDELDALVDAVECLLSDSERRHKMGVESLRKSGEMSIERMVDQTLQVYSNALRNRCLRDAQMNWTPSTGPLDHRS
ncbi:MAG: glycosyltransferase [Rhodospirillales bacterium]|nr:glycosyltransferase [Rhodospirillales bacterium]